jgi:hypothetical protein
MGEINKAWVERLHAPRTIWSQIAANNARHGILCREEKSQQQLFSWDIYLDEILPLTPPVDYQFNATLSPYSDSVTYLRPHPTHADVYQYVRVSYEGGDPQPIALTALMNASPHIEEASGCTGFTAVTGNGYIAQVWTPDGKKPLFSYESDVLAYGPFLSFDGKIAVVATMQSAESETTHLEAYDIDTGAKISQLALPDTPLEAVKFAPFMGDTRLLVQSRIGLLTRPLVWDVVSGAVDWLEGLDKALSYTACDWTENKNLLLHSREGEVFHILKYDLAEKRTIPFYTGRGRLMFAYTYQLSTMIHFEDIHGITLQTIMKTASDPEAKITEFVGFLPEAANSRILMSISNSSTFWSWTSADKNGIALTDKPRVIGVTLNDETLSYGQIAAWVEQEITYTNVDLWKQAPDIPFWSSAIEKLAQASSDHRLEPTYPPLLTAHNMAAAFALVAIHNDPSLWLGSIVVRPILDWAHLYESVAPPEKAIMRLWFGGSPTEKPDAWREASPLRQTKPLTVPVKLLYHPYDSLTPIQHIQTYAANNPTVELIDISREMVGPAHEQQEKLITRMLEAGLPLLQKGT